MPLRRAADIERPAHREMAALVVQDVQFRGVVIAAGRFVEHEGAVVPAIPQPEHHFEAFLGPVVARRVVEMPFAVEILRFRLRP